MYKQDDPRRKHCLNYLQYRDPEQRFAVNIYANHLAPAYGAKLISKYFQLDPRVSQATDFILHWARNKEVLNPGEGYLSSYALSLMVIFFLQIQKECVIPSIQLCARELTGVERNVEMPSFAKFLVPCVEENYNDDNEGKIDKDKVEFNTFDFSFNNVDMELIKKRLKLPKSDESLGALITKFFYYFGFDYPVLFHHTVHRSCWRRTWRGR